MQAIKEIIKNMTLEQKAAQLVQIPYAQIGREKSEEWARRGVGSFLHVFGEDAKRLQKIAIESGAKIPLLFGIDAVHGHCLNRKATIFPTQLSMACAFDPELIKRAGGGKGNFRRRLASNLFTRAVPRAGYSLGQSERNLR